MTFSPATMLESALESYDASRPRSKQAEIGPSSIYSCRREVYHQIKGTYKTNQNINFLPALMGTAIHSLIEEALIHEDVFGDDFLKEVEVEYDGLKGHVDLYIKSKKMVVDWKTTTKKNLKGDFFPSANYIYQIHIYGYLLKYGLGLEVETVSLVALARDGGLSDIAEYTAPYNEALALEGIKWLREIEEIVATDGKAPEPERHAKSYCSLYCPFYDQTAQIGCPGMPGRSW